MKYINKSGLKIYSETYQKVILPNEEIEIKEDNLGDLADAVRQNYLIKVLQNQSQTNPQSTSGKKKIKMIVKPYTNPGKQTLIEAYENKGGVRDALFHTRVIIGNREPILDNPNDDPSISEVEAKKLLNSIKKMEEGYIDEEVWRIKNTMEKREFIVNANQEQLNTIKKFEASPFLLNLIYGREEQLRLTQEIKNDDDNK